MIYLLLNIIFGSLFGLCIKWVQQRKQDDIVTIGMINYIAAAIGILPEYMNAEPECVNTGSVVAGATMGVCYFIAFFFVVYAIKYVGISSSTVIAVLSIMVPIICGIFIWHESPNVYQVVGIVLAMIALSLIGRSKDSETPPRDWFVPLILVAFFILAGTSRLAQESFRHVCDANDRPVFLWVAFAIAAVPSVLVLIYRRRRVTPAELMIGIALGAANLLQSYFILKALKVYDGFIVFPVVSAGGLMFTTLFAIGFLGERLNRRTCVGVSVAIVALSLLNFDYS